MDHYLFYDIMRVWTSDYQLFSAYMSPRDQDDHSMRYSWEPIIKFSVFFIGYYRKNDGWYMVEGWYFAIKYGGRVAFCIHWQSIRYLRIYKNMTIYSDWVCGIYIYIHTCIYIYMYIYMDKLCFDLTSRCHDVKNYPTVTKIWGWWTISIHPYVIFRYTTYIYIYMHIGVYANICVLSRVWCHSHFLFLSWLISLMLARILTSHILFHPLLIYSLLLFFRATQSSNFYMVWKWIWAPKWDIVICEIHSFF